jgi:hypothetical protein
MQKVVQMAGLSYAGGCGLYSRRSNCLPQQPPEYPLTRPAENQRRFNPFLRGAEVTAAVVLKFFITFMKVYILTGVLFEQGPSIAVLDHEQKNIIPSSKSCDLATFSYMHLKAKHIKLSLYNLETWCTVRHTVLISDT